MTWYLCIKWLHILSSVLLVGTGFGSAFYLYFVHRSGNHQAIAEVIRLVVRADYWFTLPTILIQPLTGFAMIYLAQQPVQQTWILASLALYALAGACWIPVYFLQLRLHKIASATLDQVFATNASLLALCRLLAITGLPGILGHAGNLLVNGVQTGMM